MYSAKLLRLLATRMWRRPHCALCVSNLERPVNTAAMGGACPTVCPSASRFPRALPTCAEWLHTTKLVRSWRDVTAVVDVSPEETKQPGAVMVTFRDEELAAEVRPKLHSSPVASSVCT